MGDLVDRFFEEEFDADVREMLEREIQTGHPAYLTLNVFNVRLDPAAQRVTIEDELDPTSTQELPLDDFVRRFAAAS